MSVCVCWKFHQTNLLKVKYIEKLIDIIDKFVYYCVFDVYDGISRLLILFTKNENIEKCLEDVNKEVRQVANLRIPFFSHPWDFLFDYKAEALITFLFFCS